MAHDRGRDSGRKLDQGDGIYDQKSSYNGRGTGGFHRIDAASRTVSGGEQKEL